MRTLSGPKNKLLLIGFTIAFTASNNCVKADFTFGEPINLGQPVNSIAEDGTPSISYDGLKLYFASDREGGYGYYDLWVSTRATTEDNWENPVNLGPIVNSEAFDGSPCISSDGLELYMESRRPEGLSPISDIWVARRVTIDDPWDTPVNLGFPVNSEAAEIAPTISAGGLQLYFASSREGGFGTIDIYVSTRQTKNDDWGAPVNLGPLVNSSTYQWFPHISDDGRTLFFARGYPEETAKLWMTTRKTVSDNWDPPIKLESIMDTQQGYGGPYLAHDNSLLYFYSTMPGGYGGWDLWQVPIIPVIDFNSDEQVDINDLVILIENWGQNEPLVDIGPTPLGDGVVDSADLEVFMSYWQP